MLFLSASQNTSDALTDSSAALATSYQRASFSLLFILSRRPKIITQGKFRARGPEFATPSAEGVSTAGAGLPPTDGITLFFLRKEGYDAQLRLGRRCESEIGC